MSRSLRVDQNQIGAVKAAVRARFHTQRELSEELGVALATVSNFLNGKPVDRAIFEELCTKLSLHWKDIAAPPEEPPPLPALPTVGVADRPITRQDWGEAPEVSTFYGRIDELSTLEQWITHDRCRLIAILGMGGMGKTTLAVKLAEQVQDEFEYVIWRSLLNAPPIDEILTDLIQFLSSQQEVLLPDSSDGKVSRLLHYLRQHRCLIVLDNAESILQGGTQVGRYVLGYEGYGNLFEQLGKFQHQSCLILTSREKPREIALLEGSDMSARSHQIQRLSQAEGWEIFKSKGCFGVGDRGLQAVLDHYAGNPLALKMVASAVQEFFDGDLSELILFLQDNKLQFSDINDLLERQFERLSLFEQQIMYWLAINRDPVSFTELETDLVSKEARRQLLGTVQSLNRRCLIECSQKQILLQPVVLEYITYRLVTGVRDELLNHRRELLRDYALTKAQSKDYIRQTQVRLILQPIIDEVLASLSSIKEFEEKLKRMLAISREESPLQPGYVGGNILNLLCELNADLTDLDCSHLTIWQAYLIGKSLHHVNFAGADLSKSVFTDTLSATLAVAFSPDGQFFAAGNSDGNIRIWRTVSGQKHMTIAGHSGWVTSIAFSPNGQFLVSGSLDLSIKIWDLTTGQCLKTLLEHTNWIWSVRLSPNGQTIVSGSADGTVRLWRVPTGECLKTLQGHTGTVWSTAFSPDGQLVASGGGSGDCTVRIWHVQTGQVLQEFQGHTSWVRSLIFAPDGQTLFSSSGDSTIKLWDMMTGQCVDTLQGHSSNVISLALTPDGKTLASSSQDAKVRIWDVASRKCLDTLQGHPNGVWSVAFHPDNQTLISGSHDSTIKLWNIKTGQSLRTLVGYNDGVRTIAFDPNHQLLASGSNDKKVKLWDTRSGECLRTLMGHTSWVWSVAFSKNGQILATSSSDNTTRLWQVETGKLLHTLQGQQVSIVMSVSFSADDQVLASGCTDQTIRLWDVQSGNLLNVVSCSEQILTVAFAPQMNSTSAIGASYLLASGGDNVVVRLWHVPSGDCIKTLTGHSSAIMSVAFSPDGRLLASGSHDQTVRIWDVQSGECLKILSCDTRVWSVCFSADGRTLVSSSRETVSLWDVRSGDRLTPLLGHDGEVYATTFLGSSNILASSGQDGTIKLWNTQINQLIRTLRDKRPYEQMNIMGVTGLSEAQKDTLKALGAIDRP
jgi:WD40 repeat protein/DNA-binding Xre family transcriptional regulator